MRLRLVITSALIAALLCAGSARAEDAAQTYDYVPARAALPGIWAARICESANLAVVFTEKFMMITGGGVTLTRIDMSPMAPDERTLVLRAALSQQEFSVTDKGILHTRTIVDESALIKNGFDYTIADQRAFEPNIYHRCAQVTSNDPLLSAENLEAIADITRIEDICGANKLAQDGGCRKALFTAWDRDDNAALDAPELARGFRVSHYLGGGFGCVTEKYYTAATAVAADSFAQEAIKRGDRDNDGALTLAEAEAALAMQGAGDDKITDLKRMAAHLGNFLPWLEKGETLGACSCEPPQTKPSTESAPPAPP